MGQFLNRGNGQDGDVSVSSSITDTPIDSSASASSGSNQVVATNINFAPGQMVRIHQTQAAAGAGVYEDAMIQSYTHGGPGQIVLDRNLQNSYSSTGGNKAQIIVIPQYRSFYVASGVTLSAKAWDPVTGTGGIFVKACLGIILIAGQLNLSGVGFIGGGSENPSPGSYQGESHLGVGVRSANRNGSGGGGAGSSNSGGAGGGNKTNGTVGGGVGGGEYGAASPYNSTLTIAGPASAGGGALGITQPKGGNGGGWCSLFFGKLIVTGSIVLHGQTPSHASSDGGAGGGAAGCADFHGDEVQGAANITGLGGSGGTSGVATGGVGSDAYIRFEVGKIDADSSPAASIQLGNLSWLGEILYISQLTTTSTSSSTSTTTTSTSTTSTSSSTTTTSSSTTTTSTSSTSSSTTTTSSSTTTTSSSTTTTSTTTTVPYSISVDAG